MSAPERSSFATIYSSKSTSSANVIRLVCILNIRRFVFWSGRGNSIFLSIRPAIEYVKVTDWGIRGAFRTQSNIYNRCENSSRLNVINYFRNKSFIADVQLDSKYASGHSSVCPLFKPLPPLPLMNKHCFRRAPSLHWQAKILQNAWLNSFMHNVVKWPNILQKSWGAHTTRFLKYVWPFHNIMHGRVILQINAYQK